MNVVKRTTRIGFVAQTAAVVAAGRGLLLQLLRLLAFSRIPCARRRSRVARIQRRQLRGGRLHARSICRRRIGLRRGCCDLSDAKRCVPVKTRNYPRYQHLSGSSLLEICCSRYDCRTGDSQNPLPSSSEKASSSRCDDCESSNPLDFEKNGRSVIAFLYK